MEPGTELTLGIMLTAAGVVVTSALVTGLVELLKTLLPLGGHERQAAFLVSAVLVVVAYASVTVLAVPPLAVAIEGLFGAFLAFYGIARLSIAHYADATKEAGSLTGPPA